MTALALVLAACAPSLKLTAHRKAARPGAAVAVYPFQLRWEAPAFRDFQLGHRVAAHVAATGRYAVFGPGEFALRDPALDNVLLATDLATTAPAEGVPVAGMLVLRGWAERREHSSSRAAVDAEGQRVGQGAGGEVEVVGHLELLEAESGEVLAEVEGQAGPPQAERDGDPAPELSALCAALTDRLLGAMEELAPGEAIARADYGALAWSPAPLYAFAERGRPALADTLASAPEAERASARARAARYFAPGADEALLTALDTRGGGLYLRQPSAGAASAGLRPGDLLTRIAGGPATPLRLQRALRRAPEGEKLAVTVEREGAPVELALPVK